ncbi:hypothetical protein HB976_07625 [Yersinia mollaretii]|uniref:three component ABC system middle component n=1 Tax=Yersinia mollaretii TaxID=33060 RepID=UPI000C1F2A24|nr:three component ABC system middle component [Yersinia mollaretii]MDA5534908.1 DUF6521 family protein [Yersinia mollaretii]NIL02825.1 hypothetical protein [Yersinia mollaretii]PJE86949.1 hypothetical protein CU280_15625 [Yersinia mollaretii]
MSSIIVNLATLHYSPIILQSVMSSFYHKIEPQKNNILLSYLVIPLFSNSKTFSFFKNAKRSTNTGKLTSTLITFSNKKENIIGLSERIFEFKELTNSCIQILIDSKAIVINENMSIELSNTEATLNTLDEKKIKSISNMAEILTEFDISSTFRILGINKL